MTTQTHKKHRKNNGIEALARAGIPAETTQSQGSPPVYKPQARSSVVRNRLPVTLCTKNGAPAKRLWTYKLQQKNHSPQEMYLLHCPSGQELSFAIPIEAQDKFEQQMKALWTEHSIETGQLESLNTIMSVVIAPERLNSEHENLVNLIFSQCNWYDANRICELTGGSTVNPSSQPNKWKKAGKLFAMRRGNKDLFPEYAFGDDFRPRPAIHEILSLFKGKKSDLKIAAWFVSANSWLRNECPKDVIGSDPEAVILAAKVEVSPIDHG